MRLTQLEVLWPKVGTVCGAAAGAAGTVISFISEIAVQTLGVPLPVVLASAAGAGLARAQGDPVSFVKAAWLTALWTAIGCICAPFAQALLPAILKVAGIDLVLPSNALAVVAAAVSSVSWWGPIVWPLILAKFGKGGANA